jgi:hypothetical protein
MLVDATSADAPGAAATLHPWPNLALPYLLPEEMFAEVTLVLPDGVCEGIGVVLEKQESRLSGITYRELSFDLRPPKPETTVNAL